MCYIGDMTENVQSSALNGNAVNEVMDGKFLFVTYHGRRKVLMVPLPKKPEDVDPLLVLVRAHFEQVIQDKP
jgi:hypothetical protein